MFKRFFPSSPASGLAQGYDPALDKLEARRASAKLKADARREKNRRKSIKKLTRAFLKKLMHDYKNGYNRSIFDIDRYYMYRPVAADVFELIKRAGIEVELTFDQYKRPSYLKIDSITNFGELLKMNSVYELFAEFKVKVK